MFDPKLFNFIQEINKRNYMVDTNSVTLYRTIPIDGHIVGKYILEYDIAEDWWCLQEIYSHNEQDRKLILYSGRIPDNDFGFILFKNMELELPVIQRELKLNEII